jgi:hypothetical protein
MSRVVPSQIVEVIDKMFPRFRDQEPNDKRSLTANHRSSLAAVSFLVEQLPDELIVLEGDSYIEFAASIAAIRQIQETWKTDQTRTLEAAYGLRQLNPIKLLRDALSKCPNEVPAQGTASLLFIDDPDFKERLRLDIGAVHHSISNGDWKAATVLGGSVIEALLLWALQNLNHIDLKTAIDRLIDKTRISKPDANLEKWDLYCFKEVATEMGVIKKDSASLIDLTREYRNLIHPGRAQRLKMKCDRATAYTAIAALDRVVDDLTDRFARV